MKKIQIKPFKSFQIAKEQQKAPHEQHYQNEENRKN